MTHGGLMGGHPLGHFIQIPEVTAQRGGIDYNTPRPKQEPDPIDPPPEGAPPGRWEYGIRDEEGVIYSSYSGYHHEPFLTRRDAECQFSWLDGTVVRRWVADAEWEVAP